METTISTVELTALAREIVSVADAREVAIRALGGVGIELRAPERPPSLHRDYGDLDVAASRNQRRPIEQVMIAAGLVAEERFNKVQGASRQIWWSADQRTHVDVFLGEFVMCHRLSFDGRFIDGHPAMPAADLLLMKLQVVELNLKDAIDAAALLTTHEIGDTDGIGVINGNRILSVLSGDWGFYTTATDNLDRLAAVIREVDAAVAPAVAAICGELKALLEEAPKSRAFSLRARVGRRKRWYELPEESL